MRKKITILATAFLFIFWFAVGGTLAWLAVKTTPVTNTFTYGDINIELWEHDLNEDGTLDRSEKVTENDDYKMVPGKELPKNPTVTVKANSEACWLFLKIEEENSFSDFMSYEVVLDNSQTQDTIEGWTELSDVNDVYYRLVDATTTDVNYEILVGNKVTVLNTVTKDQLNKLDKDTNGNELDDPTYPKLTFTAYAIQKEGFTDVADAWAEVSK